MIKDYIVLALRNLRKRGIRSWLTMLGVFLGIAAVVSLISLGQGLREAITGQFSNLAPDLLTFTSAETGFGPPGSTAVHRLTDHDLDLVKSIQGVKRAIPRIIRVVKVEFNNVANFDYIGSLPENQEDVDFIYHTFNVEASEGRLLDAKEYGKVILGDDFKRENQFEKKIKIGDRINIQGKDFEVIGFMKRASTFTINSVVLMSEKDLKDILNIKDEIDLIAIQVQDKDIVEQVAKDIGRKFRKDRNEEEGEEDFSIQTPVQSLESINTILNVINIVVVGIAIISLFIGGIGIANTMFTSVLERRKEIGVMKAIGAKNKDILSIFVTESALLGLVGGVIGAIIGLLLALGVSSIANAAFNDEILKVSISWPLLFASISFSLVIGVLSGIIPAYQASRLNPVEALRK
ncbi:MAG: ABC transporter permease [Nanoarchaeota archaeon]